ncbi:hypothetical protein KCP71_08125 [Salmonella enterica subsp. enterica]|nr:hypothetical protein KCP71_08125 [Salmonella enterica subsp. enterica]
MNRRWGLAPRHHQRIFDTDEQLRDGMTIFLSSRTPAGALKLADRGYVNGKRPRGCIPIPVMHCWRNEAVRSAPI